MSRDDEWADRGRPGFLRRIGRAAVSPWRSLRIADRVAKLQREVDELRSGDSVAQSRVRLDESGEFDLDAMAFLHGQGRRTFEGTSGDPPAIDGAQCMDLFRPWGDVLRCLALSARDHDLDGQCDADRLAVHAGLRGVLPARVPVCARELSDPTASEGLGVGVLGDVRRLLAALTGGSRSVEKRRGDASDAPPFFIPFKGISRSRLSPRRLPYWVSSNRAMTVTVSFVLARFDWRRGGCGVGGEGAGEIADDRRRPAWRLGERRSRPILAPAPIA